MTDFAPYMDLLKIKVTNDPSSLGLPENIEEIKKLYLKTEVTNLDAYKYPNLEREDLLKTIDDFFVSNKDNVFGLFGASGSGKSTLIQLKYYEEVKNW